MRNLARRYFKEVWDGENVSDNDHQSQLVKKGPDPKIAELVELVRETDAAKALTGRTPERIEQETGIPKEQMFPENAKILYVGDPWQRMGRSIDHPNLTIIDYEFGDSASFITDDQAFRNGISQKLDRLLSEIPSLAADERLDESQKAWLARFEQLVKAAKIASDEAEDLRDYPPAALAWQAAKKFIEEQYQKTAENIDETKSGDPGEELKELDAFAEFRREAWYACVYGERGFRDIPDYRNIIIPKISEMKQRLSRQGVDEEQAKSEIAQSMKGWIEEVRLKKIPKRAQVVEAMFPLLPFRAKSFDRLVASWSISAHTFGMLDETGFGECWKEIDRVLKNGGEAYIFPLHYTTVDSAALEESLAAFARQTGMEWKYFDYTGQATDDFGFAETLRLKKY